MEHEHLFPNAVAVFLHFFALVRELSRANAKGGQVRAFPDSRERARTAVRKAIKRAIDEVAAADPAIGDLLRSSLTTGRDLLLHPRRRAARDLVGRLSASVRFSCSAAYGPRRQSLIRHPVMQCVSSCSLAW